MEEVGRKGFQEERNSERFLGNMHKREMYRDRKQVAWGWKGGKTGE